MKISASWIDAPETQAVCNLLEDAGYQVFFVGGCVRNTLLGEAVSDIDLTTDAVPERVTRLAESAGMKVIPTGIDHGTVTVIFGNIPHEITTFREDVTTDGRRATVSYSTDITRDARRRDFTMNAIYARPDGTVEDPLGGMNDLKERRIKFIEDPAERIREDYLRILRFFRFHAWYGDPASGLDADGLAAIAANLDGLEGLSRERVGSEITKLLAAPDPGPSIAAMRHTGVLNAILPGADDRYISPLVHTEGIANTKPDSIRRLATLGGKNVADLLRLSKAQAKQLLLLREQMSGTAAPGELGYRHGLQTGVSVLMLRAVLLEQQFEPAELDALKKGAGAEFPVKALDLMPTYSGVELGERLKALEKQWIDSGFVLSREQLL